jgi:carbon monoxide dehydrogenase subunit G
MTNARRTVTTVSEVNVMRTPDEVYRFVTTPMNWVGTHPVTEGVEGGSGDSEGVGGSWVEIIRAPIGRFRARWDVIEAERPHRWAIRTEGFGHTSSIITIIYTFAADTAGTRFRREMNILLPKGLLGMILGPIFRSGRVHDEYLRKIKGRLESE